MNDRSPLDRFVRVSRTFGFVVAIKVAYSKIRGWLCPALALPEAPIYNAKHREVSILLSTAELGAATLDGVVDVLAGRSGLDWEVCICERSPAEPETARTLARDGGSMDGGASHMTVCRARGAGIHARCRRNRQAPRPAAQ